MSFENLKPQRKNDFFEVKCKCYVKTGPKMDSPSMFQLQPGTAIKKIELSGVSGGIKQRNFWIKASCGWLCSVNLDGDMSFSAISLIGIKMNFRF